MRIQEMQCPGEGKKVKFISDSGHETVVDLKGQDFFYDSEVQKTFLCSIEDLVRVKGFNIFDGYLITPTSTKHRPYRHFRFFFAVFSSKSNISQLEADVCKTISSPLI